MESPVCTSCSELVFENSKFCHNCGKRLKCKSCGTPLIKNANNCIECGETIELVEKSLQNNGANTIKYRRTKDEISCDVSLTNDVGKEGIAELIATISNTNINTKQNNLEILGQASNKFGEDYIEQTETEDIGIKDDNTKEQSEENQISNESNDKSDLDFPHLDDLGMTLECFEADWLLIYSYYESNFSKKTFTKEAVYKIYLDRRDSENRRKNIAKNWKPLFQDSYISTMKEKEFKFQAKGIEYVKSLINNTNQNTILRNTKRSKKTKDTDVRKANKPISAKSITFEEFDILKNDSKISLEDFFKEKGSDENTLHRIIIIGYYITKINKLNNFTDGHIDFAYRVLSLNNRPKFLHQTIVNIKNKHFWVDKADELEGWKLTRIGEIFVEEKLPVKD